MVDGVLKGGCILCFWVGQVDGWSEEKTHVWEECKFVTREVVDLMMGLVKEVEKKGRD